MTSAQIGAYSTGVGLRLAHLAEVVADRPPVPWFEIHPENFLGNPHASELLDEVAEHYPISMHTVGVSVGSASGIDRAHLKRVVALVDRVKPFLVSGHLAWSTHEDAYLNDLLPLPYDDESLHLLSTHISEVQDALGRQFLIENPSSYVAFTHSTMSEVEFLGELVARTGCGLLCDVSNIYLSAHNVAFDPQRYIEALPANAIGELHLGGFTAEADEADAGGTVLIDTHAAAVCEPAWTLYTHAVRSFGSIPTLIEWDNEIPALPVLIAEARRADAIKTAFLAQEERCDAVG
ncbi:MAG: DUF692 domain-containing protein [Xanthobacteraceae bacterium]|nr:DUF692 domain-containing protein [Xanthobacteraceae bacterium]